MPSWNIHSAHAEKLLADCGAAALGVADENAFLFGNFVPEVLEMDVRLRTALFGEEAE